MPGVGHKENPGEGGGGPYEKAGRIRKIRARGGVGPYEKRGPPDQRDAHPQP